MADQIDTARLRDLLARATEGPWESLPPDETDMFVPIIGSNLGGLVGGAMLWPTEIDAHDFSRAQANAELIVAMCAALPALLDAYETGGGREASVAKEWDVYMTDAVSKAPEPLRQLGEYLAGLLDEDRWKTAERYLNAAVLATTQPTEAAIRADEREKCAKVADSFVRGLTPEFQWVARDIAAAIRVRASEGGDK